MQHRQIANEDVTRLQRQLDRREVVRDLLHEKERLGQWIGAGAKRLGLSNTVMREQFRFSHAMVLMYDPLVGKLYAVASTGYPQSGVGAEIELGAGVIGVAAQERVHLLLELLLAHLPVRDEEAQVRAELPELLRSVLDRVDAIVEVERLATARVLASMDQANVLANTVGPIIVAIPCRLPIAPGWPVFAASQCRPKLNECRESSQPMTLVGLSSLGSAA
jgi:hypothetical protein